MHASPFASSVVAMTLASGILSAANADDLATTSMIDGVVVYTNGADVTRSAKLKIEPGEHAVIINDLPAGALPQSIRVEGRSTGGQLQIGSVDTRKVSVPRADAAALNGQRRDIEDKIEKLRDQRHILEADIQAAEAQKALVTELTKTPSRAVAAGAATADPDWSKLLVLVAEKMAAAQRSILDTNLKIRDLDRQITDLQHTLTSLAPAPEMRTEVKVFVSTTAATDADLTVRYQVANAGWTPFYDARLATGAKGQPPKLQLIRRASIQQRSGEGWDNVALTLSTTRPSAATAAPELQMLSVDYEAERQVLAAAPPPAPMAVGAARAKMATAQSFDGSATDQLDAAKKLAEESVAVAARDVSAGVETQGFQVLYSIPGRVSVAPTGEQKRVQISAEDLDPSLVIRSVPRLNPLAYLYAKLSMPKTSTPLLPGNVSLFRDGTFVGQGQIPQLAPGEDHELGFGADDLVKVKRVVIEDKKGEQGVFTTTRAEERNYTISVKNLHPNAVLVQVLDRIPVSMQQDIKVDPTFRPTPTRKDVNDRRGTIAWDLTVNPDQETQIAFGYKVTAPAGKPMQYRELTAQQVMQNNQMRY